MRVFVAGASGAIGKPLIEALFAAKHETIGMTTSAAGLRTLQDRGAQGTVSSALDSDAVQREIARFRPDAIIDELTSLPKRYTPDEMKAAAPRDGEVRLSGGGNLFRAAINAGVKRYIVQSTGFFYGPGEGLASETDPLAKDATAGIAGSVATYMQIEGRVFSFRKLRASRCVMASFMVRAPSMICRLEASQSRCDRVNTRLLDLGRECPPSSMSKMRQQQRCPH
jgi:2-alkyl-3-oxoalkanoate reductase